ncbi:MAG: prolyl oligopeptidase family serine peptidase [Gemmataceae bacterium]
MSNYDDTPRRRRRVDDDDEDDDFEERPRPRRRRRAIGSNGVATAALILGILSLCLGPLAGLPAIICGVLGIAAAGRERVGRGPAIAGTVLGGVSFGLTLLAVLAFNRSWQAAIPGKLAEWAMAKPVPVEFPELGPGRPAQPGVVVHESTVMRGTVPMRVWFYRPERAEGRLPLVLVPPAGSTLVCGMRLAEGDRLEHLPYAAAGFAVASFDIDGDVPRENRPSEAAVLKGAREFRDAQAGLANVRAALDFVLAKAPDVDPGRVYIAGHSSAATLALLTAEHEPRVAACAAFGGVPDVEDSLAKAIPALNRALPGYRTFLNYSSPKTGVETLKCPVFLFHAEDDTVVPIRQCTDFAALLRKTNPNVTLVTTPAGGHYDSMIQEGIPKCIEWLKRLPKGE